MKTEINIQVLFEEMFNSNIFDKHHLWDNFLEYEFSPNELAYVEKIKNETLIDFSGISEDKLVEVFKSCFHKYGFFDFQFDNLQEGWLYPTVQFFYNDDLDLGYIYTVDYEIIPFKGFSNGEEIFEKLIDV
jgi:hypothetical protein